MPFKIVVQTSRDEFTLEPDVAMWFECRRQIARDCKIYIVQDGRKIDGFKTLQSFRRAWGQDWLRGDVVEAWHSDRIAQVLRYALGYVQAVDSTFQLQDFDFVCNSPEVGNLCILFGESRGVKIAYVFNFARVKTAVKLSDSCVLSLPIKAYWSQVDDKLSLVTPTEAIMLSLQEFGSNSKRIVATRNELITLKDIGVKLTQPRRGMPIRTLSDFGYNHTLHYMRQPAIVRYENGSTYNLSTLVNESSTPITFKAFEFQLSIATRTANEQTLSSTDAYECERLDSIEVQAEKLYIKAHYNIWRNSHSEVGSLRLEAIKLGDVKFKLLVAPSLSHLGELEQAFHVNIMVLPDELFIPVKLVKSKPNPIDVLRSLRTLVLTDGRTLCRFDPNKNGSMLEQFHEPMCASTNPWW